jgi:hypothetical protein
VISSISFFFCELAPYPLSNGFGGLILLLAVGYHIFFCGKWVAIFDVNRD